MKKTPPTVSGQNESKTHEARKERMMTRLELIKMPEDVPSPNTLEDLQQNLQNLTQDLEDFQSGSKPLSADLVNCLEMQLRLLMGKKRDGSGPDFDPEPPPGGATALPVPTESTPTRVRMSA